MVLLSTDTKRAYEEGDFLFTPEIARPFCSFAQQTPFDEEIEETITEVIDDLFLEDQMNGNRHLFSTNETGLRNFTSKNAIKLVEICEKVIRSIYRNKQEAFKKDKKNKKIEQMLVLLHNDLFKLKITFLSSVIAHGYT